MIIYVKKHQIKVRKMPECQEDVQGKIFRYADTANMSSSRAHIHKAS